MLFYRIVAAFALTASMLPCEVLSSQFALLPDVFDLKDAMRDPTDVGSAASSPQECVDLVVVAEPTAIAISFDSTTGACLYSTSIYSYDRRVGVQTPVFYLRTDNLTKTLSEADCFTTQDAEYLIAKLTFGDAQCVESTYDGLSRLCISVMDPSFTLGRYDAGRLANGSRYMLSREKAIEAIDYECPYAYSQFSTDDDGVSKMIFGGTWYCYGPLNVSSEADKPAVIKNNKCAASLGGSSAPLKITETREYGFVYDMWTFAQYSEHVYLGLYTTGYTQSGGYYYYDYAWYDGSTAVDLPWTSGYPYGELAKNMVWATGGCTVADWDGSDMDVIACKTPATYTAYDPSVKFL